MHRHCSGRRFARISAASNGSRPFERAGSDPFPAWADTPGIAPGSWAELQLDVDGVAGTLATLPGVFAGTRIDVGTELLLAHLDVESGERVLDVGCGAGVIGLTACDVVRVRS